ncbi:hypothetical protein [Rathayibacter soli]|uniref:hypothetical protein n=1 Tax=Rathayibacter soli TaxID=3144168 RepID=UPI0027E47895|nr:hypothetical protein [Glaciibacter superstes]
MDDLLIDSSAAETAVSVAIACRATPNFVPSHEASVKLVRSLLDEIARFDSDTQHVAVATAGWQSQWEELATVCLVAQSHADPTSFRMAIDVKGRWSRQVRNRLKQFLKMVEKAEVAELSEDEVLALGWKLLSRLHVIGFAVQGPNATDRTNVALVLDSIAADGVDGITIRDRIEVEATRYDATGAIVDQNLLRRDLHGLLPTNLGRNARAWEVLADHRRAAISAVRTTMGESTSVLEIPFQDRHSELGERIRAVGLEGSALVVAGESGTGKSALVLSTIAELESKNPGDFEALVLNFRALPRTSLELRSAVGFSIDDALEEMAAPIRMLVIDAADAALERSEGLLVDLGRSAASTGTGLVVVTSDVAEEFVRDQVARSTDTRPSTFTVQTLDDDDISKVATKFPSLRNVLRDLPTDSLFRRLVVLDLLARTGLELRQSMSEWECLETIWRHVARGEGRPEAGSAEGRERALLAVAAMNLGSARASGAHISFEAVSIDALRRDHLLAPANPFVGEPQFAHDEVRRYATAILLVRSPDVAAELESAHAPRWAMSAAVLACRGALDRSPREIAPIEFVTALTRFRDLGAKHGARWADVPIEAVLGSTSTYECLNTAVRGTDPVLAMSDLVRVVQQRHTIGGLVNQVVAAPVVELLLQADEPWAGPKDSFELLTSWLRALVMTGAPSGNRLRIMLRDRLLRFWDSFPADVDDTSGAPAQRPQQHRRLDYHVTREEFVETLALLGPDIDAAVENALRLICERAPAFLAPAADSPFSARALILRDPELLADMIEAYYIDTDADRWGPDDGVRSHQGRWTFIGPPFSAFWFGGFWPLFQNAPYKTSVRVLNNILNHGAKFRVETLSKLRRPSAFAAPIEPADFKPEPDGLLLDLDGTPRLYTGDSHVWSWYRGTSVGPEAATSALLAMQRTVDRWLDQGVLPSTVMDALLEGCSNLAVPGLLYGTFVRHLERLNGELDRYLAEPSVWELEFGRVISESFAFRAPSDDVVNAERWRWTPPEVAMWLVTVGGDDRREELSKVAAALVANGHRIGLEAEVSRNWAAALDASNFELTQQGDQVLIQVVPSPEVQLAQARHQASRQLSNTALRLQNRYWSSRKHDLDYVPPTAAEVARDLRDARELIQADDEQLPTRSLDILAHVARAAIELAADGQCDELGDQGNFAVRFVLDTASDFLDVSTAPYDEQFFDLGADRAVALALPALLTTSPASLLASTGASPEDVAKAGLGMARHAALETRLYLARGCDRVWPAACHGDVCIHSTAIDWLIETARNAEIGDWDPDNQRRSRCYIEGDVPERLARIAGDSIDIRMLDAVIRGLGAASAIDHCQVKRAQSLLAHFLEIQRRAMVHHAREGYSVDDRGTHNLVAARALLSTVSSDGELSAILTHLDAFRGDAGLLMHFLHGIAGAGAERKTLAGAARQVWPALLRRAITYASEEPDPFRDGQWGDWAAAALLPTPLSWAAGMYSELGGPPIDWVHVEDLVDLIGEWLPLGRNKLMCVDALISVVARLPIDDQVSRGISWLSELCLHDDRALASWTSLLNKWLTDVRRTADSLDRLVDWQVLVDALVVAGDDALAPYSK